jgi:molybdopterin synthase sulfur carrier subunit
MEVRLYATLRLKAGQTRIDLKASAGDTVRDAIRELLEHLPILSSDVMTDDGELVDHVHLFLNGRNVRLLGGLDALIQEGQKLDIFPPVGGGRHSHETFSRARLV